ncbi:DNA-binding protein HU-beta [Persephonella hydrogeniphila]|uniref:DNA-binding protein HU-beta n=1 Tax=Persephonella hydrogeniphila TaxID=198703 RepID=A0A285NFQ1_9AQUI|nr:HU family DNA-binding protein [Persephonella hydrogeniphila]SNZ07723.1 DNA-binding protein HU-beta [Persephonella hydrogeniphila]
MTKAELIAKMAAQAGVSKASAERCLNGFVNAITEALEKGERVAIPNLGVFNVKEKAARTGRNPRTGEVVQIPARKAVKFSPSAVLKKKVNS